MTPSSPAPAVPPASPQPRRLPRPARSPRPLAGLLAAALLAACQPAPPDEDIGARAQALGCHGAQGARLLVHAADRIHAAFSQHLGLQAGFLPLLDEDVTYLAPNQDLLHGKAAVRAYLAGTDPAGTARLRWDTVRVNASADASLGYTLGWTVRETPVEGEPPQVAYGKSIAVWKRRAAGWRVVAYLAALAPAVPVAAPAGYPLFPDRQPQCGAPSGPARADVAFAARSLTDGVAAAFRDFAAPDAALRPGNRYVVGPDAIYALYAGAVAPGETLEWRPVEGGVAGSGDIGYTIGLSVDTVPDPDGALRFYGKYLTVWERQPGGAWRYVTDGGSARPTPPPGSF